MGDDSEKTLYHSVFFVAVSFAAEKKEKKRKTFAETFCFPLSQVKCAEVMINKVRKV